MAEYIERGTLYKKLHDAGGCDADSDTWAAGYDAGIDTAIDILRKAPAADVVEVVRCGECKGAIPLQHSDYVVCCGCRKMPKTGFCSYGERKDGAE